MSVRFSRLACKPLRQHLLGAFGSTFLFLLDLERGFLSYLNPVHDAIGLAHFPLDLRNGTAAGVLALLLFLSLKEFVITISRANIFKRQALGLCIGLTFLSLMLMTTNLSAYGEHSSLLALPLSALFANYFQYIKKWWWQDLLILLCAAAFLIAMW